MKPNFEKILIQYPSYNSMSVGEQQMIQQAMKEVWNLAIDIAAESAEIMMSDVEIDIQSILKHKIK